MNLENLTSQYVNITALSFDFQVCTYEFKSPTAAAVVAAVAVCPVIF